MYAKIPRTNAQGKASKDHHHVRIDKEFKNDCLMWIEFLTSDLNGSVLCRPFIDLDKFSTSTTLNFFSDASGKIGYGATYDKFWMHGLWPTWFLNEKNPSIEYLELYALCGAMLTWGHLITNTWVVIFCDNQVVIDMVNNTSSRCKNWMVLIRKLVLDNLRFNRRVFTHYIATKDNYLADALSRNKIHLFKKLASKDIAPMATKITEEIWPVECVWLD